MRTKSMVTPEGIQNEASVPHFCSQRFLLSYVLLFGTFVFYIMRANMSVAIVCMTNDGPKDNNTEYNMTVAPPDDCPNQPDKGTSQRKMRMIFYASFLPPARNIPLNVFWGEFDWDRSLRGFILSSFYIGYILTQFPSGWLSKKFGPKLLILIGMTTLVVATLLTPLGARGSVYILITLQIIKGAASGLYFPSMYTLWGRWAPLTDRSVLVAISLAGAPIGSVFSSIFSGLLCANGFDGGWASIFYVYGMISSVWCLAWFFLGTNSPAENSRISTVEQEFIENSLAQSKEENALSVPWRRLWTSLPFWAVLVADFMYAWNWFTALNVLPQYMKDVLRFNIKDNGFFNALPYLGNFFITIGGSFLADGLLKKGVLSRTWTRKLLTTLALFPASILAFATGFLNCHQVPVAITLLTFWVALLGLARSGCTVNPIDLAPAYAGVMSGIVQTLVGISGIVSPTITGLMTPQGKPEQWRNVFFLGSGLALFGWLFYMIFGDGREQEWSMKAKESNKKEHPEEQL